MRVLITGANGHIGCHVTRAVAAEGWTPVAFVRPGSDRRGLAGVKCELREGDLTDAASVRRAMEGIEAVMHVGAVHRNAEATDGEMARTALDGTTAVLEAAAAAKVRRLVLTSSGATVGFAPDPSKPLDESHHQQRTSSPYTRAKVEQERLALALGAKLGVEVVVTNPTGVFGPRDYRLTPATRGLIGLLQGDPAIFHLCVTDVRDVGASHVLAWKKGAAGQRYLVAGDQLSPRQVADLFAELGGARPMAVRPPAFVLRFVIGRAEKKAKREQVDPPASLANLEDLAGGHLAYDAGRSRRELGMTYRPAKDVLRDSFRWLLHVKALKPKVEERVRAALGSAAVPDSDWT